MSSGNWEGDIEFIAKPPLAETFLRRVTELPFAWVRPPQLIEGRLFDVR
jgi:hypothetical protein